MQGTEDSARVVALTRVVVESGDPAEWLPLAKTVMGGAAVATDGGVTIEFSGGSTIAFRTGTPGALSEVGWSVSSRVNLETIAARAAANAVSLGLNEVRMPTDTASTLSLLDPDGVQIELAVAPAAGSPGGGSSLGHLVTGTRNLTRALGFYVGVLGMRISDRVRIPLRDGGETFGVFLRSADRRHHSLALIENASGLRHVMIERLDVDEVGAASDRCNRAGSISRSLGRHTNDRTLSFYFRGPDPFEVEIGCEGILVDDATWSVQSYSRPSIWGHNFVTPREGEPA